MRQTGVLFALDQARCAGVAPSAFDHERVPHLDLFGVGSATLLETPLQNVLVGTPGEHAGDKLLVADVDESAEPVVEGAGIGKEADMIVRWQLARRVKSYFVDQSGDQDDARDHDVRAADGKTHAAGRGTAGDGCGEAV